MKREFLQLAQTYDPAKFKLWDGWFISEKLDGMRAYWDGGTSRGLPASQVPWANTAKDARYREPPVSTGLFSRYGKVICAPDGWLDKLPRGICLDGELYMGRGRFQDVMSVVKRLAPSDISWGSVQYKVFDTPGPPADGIINTPNMKVNIVGAYRWWLSHGGLTYTPRPFEAVVSWMRDNLGPLYHEQELLSGGLEDRLEEVTRGGGEGLMLRRGGSYWVPGRTWDLLKVKRLLDMEGIVVGYVAGEETNLGSKLLGLMGSLIIQLPNGKRFNLSGFTDAERAFGPGLADIPGQIVPPSMGESPVFPLGSTVTFKYRELTNDGLPKEARYWRS